MTNMLQIKSGIFVSILAVLFAAIPAHAADVVGGIDMQTFTADVYVAADAHVTVTETISGEFQTPHHGVYRSIPFRYTVDGRTHYVPLTITEVTKDGASVPYIQSKEEGSSVLKIGDADILVSGLFTYVITYEADRVVLSQDSGAFFAWDAPGDDWEDRFEAVTVTVSTDAASAVLDTACYTGEFGMTSERCTAVQEGQTVTFTTEQRALTAAVVFDPSVVGVPKESPIQTLLYDHSDYLFLLLPLAALVAMFVSWWHKGRDPAGRGVIVAEYEPPTDMGPGEVGALHDGKVHKHDVIAMIVDLAVRGYVVIEERGKHYALVRTEKGEEGLREYEAQFIRTAFGSDKEVVLQGRVERFGRAWKAAASSLHQKLQTDGLFVKNPETVRGTFIAAGILVLIVTWFVAPEMSSWSIMPFVAGVSTAVIVIIFGLQMPRRTTRGVIAWEHVQGYKLFLSTAEKYRLEWQEREGIFEKYLPYALALGVAEKWTKELGSTLQEPPRWYHGNWSTWNTWYFMHTMNSFSSSMARSYTTSTQSSRSGGGGFSGGGFGGGGGGGW